jgi:hypothetical protein
MAQDVEAACSRLGSQTCDGFSPGCCAGSGETTPAVPSAGFRAPVFQVVRLIAPPRRVYTSSRTVTLRRFSRARSLGGTEVQPRLVQEDLPLHVHEAVADIVRAEAEHLTGNRGSTKTALS